MNEPSLIEELLSSSRTIALVGYSERGDRPSNSIARYLVRHGYRVIPVNPQLRRALVGDEQSYDRLVDIPKDQEVDFVNVFRRGEFLDGVVDDAIAAGLRAIWFQIQLGNVAAAERAERSGLKVVWDRCIAVEHSIRREAVI